MSIYKVEFMEISKNKRCEGMSLKHCIKMWNSRYYKKDITHLRDRIKQLEKEKAKLYDRCLENEEAMYDAVINGNDNHLIELVEKRS